MATDNAVQITKPAEITANDLHDAYLFAGLRKLKIGLMTAMESPAFRAALRGTALAKKRKEQHGEPAPIQRAIELEKAA